MIELVNAGPENRDLLWNILQKYLYEMTACYNDEMDAAGNYQYGYFNAYFSEAERKALLIYHDNSLTGFAMINPYSYLGETPDFVMAEFTIFPMYRGKHVASEAAGMMIDTYRGQWEIKYHEKNLPAKRLWYKVAGIYCPRRVKFNDSETVLCFSTR